MPNKTITLRVTRYDPTSTAEPRLMDYTVPFSEDLVVLDALNHIKDDLDGTLSFRWSCRMGICGSCGMTVNGKPRLTCSTFLREFYPEPVVVEPLRNFPIIRDLIVDIGDFIDKLGQIKPWVIPRDQPKSAGGEYLQTPEQVEEFIGFSSCINCMLCYAACPVYGLDPEFLGPAAIALAKRYNLDSRDAGASERLPVIAASSGVWECTYVGECSVVCPKGVDPARAIQQSKVDSTVALLLPFGKR